jgi:hypothetical protein
MPRRMSMAQAKATSPSRSSLLFHPLQPGTGVQLESLARLRELEDFLELVRAMDDVRFPSSPTSGNVLD